ncbi:hypothetical protein VTJ04DRAFT_6010 [Mycothermus thermophilus]|uniref:uncharacterized protein n=1 Tax=Humicola insolens TaxID=85995 RepID=UPI003742A31D
MRGPSTAWAPTICQRVVPVKARMLSCVLVPQMKPLRVIEPRLLLLKEGSAIEDWFPSSNTARLAAILDLGHVWNQSPRCRGREVEAQTPARKT